MKLIFESKSKQVKTLESEVEKWKEIAKQYSRCEQNAKEMNTYLESVIKGLRSELEKPKEVRIRKGFVLKRIVNQ